MPDPFPIDRAERILWPEHGRPDWNPITLVVFWGNMLWSNPPDVGPVCNCSEDPDEYEYTC